MQFQSPEFQQEHSANQNTETDESQMSMISDDNMELTRINSELLKIQDSMMTQENYYEEMKLLLSQQNNQKGVQKAQTLLSKSLDEDVQLYQELEENKYKIMNERQTVQKDLIYEIQFLNTELIDNLKKSLKDLAFMKEQRSSDTARFSMQLESLEQKNKTLQKENVDLQKLKTDLQLNKSKLEQDLKETQDREKHCKFELGQSNLQVQLKEKENLVLQKDITHKDREIQRERDRQEEVEKQHQVNLKESNDHFISEQEKLKNQIEGLELEIQKKNSDINYQKDQIKLLQNHLREYQDKEQGIKREQQESRKSILMSGHQSQILQIANKKLNEDVEAYLKKIDSLETQLTQKTHEQEQEYELNQELKQANQKLQTRFSDIDDKFQELSEQLKEQIQSAQIEFMAQKSKIEENERIIEDKENEIDLQKHELNRLQNIIDENQKELQNVKEELIESKRGFYEKNSEKMEKDQFIKDLEKQIESQNEKLKVVQQQLQNSQKDLKFNQQENSSREKEILRLEDEIRLKSNEFKKLILDKHNEIESLEKKLNQIEESFQQQKIQLLDKQQQFLLEQQHRQNVIKELHNENAEVIRLKQKNQDLQNENDKHLVKITKLIEDARQDEIEKERHIKEKEAHIDELKNLIDNLKKEQFEQLQEIRKLKVKINELVSSGERNEDDKNSLILGLQGNLNEIQTEFRALKEILDQRVQENVKQQKKISSLEDEERKVKKTFADQLNQKDKSIEDLESKIKKNLEAIQNYQSEKDDLNHNIAIKVEEIASIKQNKWNLELEYNKLKVRSSEQQSQYTFEMGQKNDIINNLEHEIEQKQSQIQKLVLEQSTQEQQKDELRMENQRLTTDCHANFNKLQIKTKEYELSIEESNLKYHQSQEVAGQLKNQIEILNLQIETFKKECNEYRQTINDLQKHHQRFNNEKNQTETQLHKLQDQSKHQKESMENQLKELNQLLFQKNDEIQIWSDKCLSQQKRTAVEKEELIQKFKDQNLQINELNLRIQQVTNQRDELRDVRIINLEKQLSQYENKLNETQDKLESTLENHREMTLKQQSLTKEYNAISLDNVKYGELNNSLNEQLITLRETVTELQKDIILKDEQLLVNDEQQQLLDILKKEFSKKYHELEDKNNYLQDENHRLQGQLKQNFKDVTIVRAKNDEQTNLLIKLNQQMGENNNLNEQQSNMIIKLSSQLDLDKQIIEDLNEKISIFTIFFKDIHNNLRDHYLIDTKLESERLYKILYEVSILGNHHLISLSQETQIAEKLQFYLKNLMKIHQNHQILWEKFNKFYVVNVINGPQGSINEFRSSSLNRHTTSKQSQNRSLSSFSYEYEQASTQQSTKISSPKSQKKILESVQQMLKINSPSLAANRVKQLLKYEKFAQLVTDSMLICYPLGHFDSRPSIMEVWKWFKNILYSYESLSYDSVQLKKFLDNGNHSLLEVSSPKNTFTSFTNDKTKNLERILNKVRIILEQDSLNDLESFLDSELVQKEKMAS